MVLRYWKAEKSDGQSVSLMSERLFGLQELSNGSFRDFPLKAALNILLEAQKRIERDGLLEGSIHRFYIVAKKISAPSTFPISEV